MAVPKKRISKSKKSCRLAKWSRKANLEAEKALSMAKSILKGNATSFVIDSDFVEKFSKIS
jgi:large subunit ribosomal protein L32